MPEEADGLPVNAGAPGGSDHAGAAGASTAEEKESGRSSCDGKDGKRDSGGSSASGVEPGAVGRSPSLSGKKMESTGEVMSVSSLAAKFDEGALPHGETHNAAAASTTEDIQLAISPREVTAASLRRSATSPIWTGREWTAPEEGSVRYEEGGGAVAGSRENRSRLHRITQDVFSAGGQGDTALLDDIAQRDLSELDRHLDWGWRISHVAAACGMDEVLLWLSQERPELLGVQNDCGFTPMHYAAANGQFDALKILVRKAPVGMHMKTHDGRRPIDLARRGMCRRLLEVMEQHLFKHGAQRNPAQTGSAINRQVSMDSMQSLGSLNSLDIQRNSVSAEFANAERLAQNKAAPSCWQSCLAVFFIPPKAPRHVAQPAGGRQRLPSTRMSTPFGE